MSEKQAIRKRKITVMIRVKVHGKWIRKPPLYCKRKIRPGSVMIDGEERTFGVDACNYELRYYEGGQRRLRAEGKDAMEAEAQRVMPGEQTYIAALEKSIFA